MNTETTTKKAEDLQPGDVIVSAHEGREHEAIVCDVRHVSDGLIHADAGDGTEFYSGKKVKAGETVACALAPGEAAVYVLKR